MSEAERKARPIASAGKGEEVTRREDSTPLRSDLGQTTIGEGVVTRVVGLAAREVAGVHDLGGGAARAIGNVSQKVGLGDVHSQGVSVETGETEAAVDLTLVIDYGESIPRIADAVRSHVIKRVESITGLLVTEVNITVNDLYFPGDDADEAPRVA